MSILTNTVFLGCNYNDKKIKRQFDNLKAKIEKDTPLSCIIIDKRRRISARDMWKDIRDHIEQSSAVVFDVTAFRPNVVLELGYAFSIKSEDRIFITFRKRKSHGQVSKWLLSDIGHLQRFEYISISALDRHIRQQLEETPYLKGYLAFLEDCNSTNAVEKYKEYGLKILISIRDEGSKSSQQLRDIMAGSACRFTQMTRLLKRHNLLVRGVGRHGRHSIPHEEI